MPTLLAVRLHMRRSARAGPGASPNPRTSAVARAVRRWAGGKRLSDEDDAAIVDIGAGRAGPDEIADALEEAGRIVVGEHRGRIEAGGAGAGQRRRVDEATGRVGGLAAATIGAVGVGRDAGDAGLAAERDGKRQGVFLVRPAMALAPDGDGELAARDQRRLAACGLDLAGEARVLGRHLAGLAL